MGGRTLKKVVVVSADRPQQVAPRPPCFVRLLRRRPDGYVEFVFSIGDPELGVELILPAEGYTRFCADNGVRFISAEQAVALDAQGCKWRFGQPGITE